MKSLDCKLPLASRSNRCAYVPTPRYGDFLSILTQPYCGQQKCTAVKISIRGKAATQSAYAAPSNGQR